VSHESATRAGNDDAVQAVLTVADVAEDHADDPTVDPLPSSTMLESGLQAALERLDTTNGPLLIPTRLPAWVDPLANSVAVDSGQRGSLGWVDHVSPVYQRAIVWIWEPRTDKPTDTATLGAVGEFEITIADSTCGADEEGVPWMSTIVLASPQTFVAINVSPPIACDEVGMQTMTIDELFDLLDSVVSCEVVASELICRPVDTLLTDEAKRKLRESLDT
jgi:hypothetical protein